MFPASGRFMGRVEGAVSEVSANRPLPIPFGRW